MNVITRNFPADTTVLIVEDHPLFRDALSMTLNEFLGISGISSSTCMTDALALIADGLAPDLIILDLNLPDVSGMDGLLRLKSALPGTPVVVVSSLSDHKIITSVIRSGAAGFVSKDSPREVIAQAFETVWNGDIFTPTGYAPPTDATDELNETAQTLGKPCASRLHNRRHQCGCGLRSALTIGDQGHGLHRRVCLAKIRLRCNRPRLKPSLSRHTYCRLLNSR